MNLTPISSPAQIAALIRMHRRHQGLTQAELAARAGVGREWIIEVEKGKATAELALVLKTLRVLNVSLRAELPPEPPKPAGTP